MNSEPESSKVIELEPIPLATGAECWGRSLLTSLGRSLPQQLNGGNTC